MNLRDQAMREHPEFPWLDVDDMAGVETLMRRLDWMQADESIASVAIAGPGNMNLTLKVTTSLRETVLKQARPWVEKFSEIPAPWDRASNEIAFYRAVSAWPDVSHRMPGLLGFDDESHTLLLEFLDGEGDFSDLYIDPGTSIAEPDLLSAADFLATLHVASSLNATDKDVRIKNQKMRALNFEHIFEIPLANNSGVELDALAPGLGEIAATLRHDPLYREIVVETGQEYLGEGPCLLHGDFFPGSWLRTQHGLRVIDPEFCFHGVPEFDLGCAIAHFALANLTVETARSFRSRYRESASGIELREHWVGRFAGVEVMRRLIGVAQLPLPVEAVTGAGDGPPPFRKPLLERSRDAVVSGDVERLWTSP